jgi:ABC-type uncharacterized transport system substrate-binding protein
MTDCIIAILVGKPEKAASPSENAGQHAIKGRIYKIGFTYFAPDVALDMTTKGLWEGLKQLGFVIDSNLLVISQHANGEMANLQPIHLNMDSQDVDLLLVTTTPGITAALSTVKKHPLVFTFSYTPLAAGAGKSYTDHLPNITGVGSFPPVEKTFDFIKDILPDARRIGTLYNSSEANSVKVMEEGRKRAKMKGLELIENTVINSSEVYQAASALCMKNIDAVWITGDNTATQAIHAIIKVCRDNKMPLILNDVDYVAEGAMAAVGIGWFSTGFHTAPYVARVLNGESPAKIPIENFVEEDISINDVVAKKLNIKIPDKYRMGKNVRQKPFNPPVRIAMVHYVFSPDCDDVTTGILARYKETGHIRDKDFIFDEYNANADVGTLNTVARVVADKKYDLIFVTVLAATQALVSKISNVPILFTVVADPVGNGLGKSYNDHKSNLAGIDCMAYTDEGLVLLQKYIPGARTLGVLYCPGEMASVSGLRELEQSCKNKNIKLIAVPVNTVSEVVDATTMLCMKNIDAISQMPDNITIPGFSSMVKITRKHKVPLFCYISSQVEMGAIAAIAGDFVQQGREIADVSFEVIKGKSPSAIPFSRIKQIRTVINPQAASAYGLETPKAVYDIADHIVKNGQLQKNELPTKKIQ